MHKEYHIPSWNPLRFEKIQKETHTNIEPVNAVKEGIFGDIYEEGETETSSNHHLLGHYGGIQHECHELNFINKDISNDRHLTLDEINRALEWKLLFQFDSDHNLEFSWADWAGFISLSTRRA